MELFAMKFGSSVKVTTLFTIVFCHSALSLSTIFEGDRSRIQLFVNMFREAHSQPYPLRSRNESPTTTVKSGGQCGGFMELAGQSIDLYYEIPKNVHHVSCIWVVWSKYGRSIRIQNLGDMHLQVLWNYESQGLFNGPPNWTSIKIDSFDTRTLEVNEKHAYAVLFFNANQINTSSRGLKIKLSETGNRWINNLFKTCAEIMHFEKQSGGFVYPSSKETEYKDLKRLFIIGHVPKNTSLKWQLHFNIEENRDWLGLFWLHRSTWNKYSSTGKGSITNKPPIQAGSSFILTFSSEEYMNNNEFTFEYINENTNDNSLR